MTSTAVNTEIVEPTAIRVWVEKRTIFVELTDGNTDFLNMLERSRLESKKISKTNSVTSQLPYEMAPANIHIGPSDYVEWLSDRKWAYIRMEGTTFGNVPLNVEMKLEVWASPNSAGLVIDAVRCCKLALDNGLKGALIEPSSYFKKSPPVQYTDEEARRLTEEFIAKYGWKQTGQKQPLKIAARKPEKAKTATAKIPVPSGPGKIGPGQIGFGKVGFGKVFALVRSASASLEPKRNAPESAAPVSVAAERSARQRSLLERLAPARSAMTRFASESSAPERSASARFRL